MLVRTSGNNMSTIVSDLQLEVLDGVVQGAGVRLGNGMPLIVSDLQLEALDGDFGAQSPHPRCQCALPAIICPL